MTVYYVTLFSCVILAYAAEKNDYVRKDKLTVGPVDHPRKTRNLFILLSIILVVVAGFRYGVGGDYWGYYRASERFSNELVDSIKTFSEPGIKLLYTVVRWFSQENIAPMFATAALTISLMLGVIYRHTEKLLMAVVLFLFLGCWHDSFNAVRQCIAVAIVFSGYGFLKERKLLQYSLVVLLAFLFHRSSIMMILPFFIVHIKISPLNILLLIIGAVIALYAFDRIMTFTGWVMQEEEELMTEYAQRQVGVPRILVAIAPAAYFLFVTRGQERDEAQTFYLNLLIVHAAVAVVTSPSAMLGRYSLYTAPFCAIAIPELNKLKSAKITLRNGRALSGGALICLLFFAYWVYAIQKDFTLNPYIWYFSHH